MIENATTHWLAERYEEIAPLDFYRDLFPQGELDERGKMTKGKYCGIAVQIKEQKKAFRFTICNDLEPIEKLIKQDDFLIISPISYAGKAQTKHNARFIYSLTFDLDGLRVDGEKQVGLEQLYHKIYFEKHLPEPTYLVSSGTGIHLYYLLEKPLGLFDETLKNLWFFRMAMTNGIWDERITEKATNPQYESVTQGFRAVGSVCKDGVNRVRAFKVGGRVSIEELNRYVDDECKIKNVRYKSKLTREEAKEKYPEWYERRIEQGNPKGYWTCHKGLYLWWLQKIKDGENKFPEHKVKGAQVGHRYFSIMALAIYARKCGIPRKQLEQDALNLIPLLDSRTDSKDNRFTVEDVMKALDAYSAEYITFPRDSIRDLTNIDIQPNKRNGRKQAEHLKIARMACDVDNPNGSWRYHETKEQIIYEYVATHPDYKNTPTAEIARECGVSRTTVYKWLSKLKEEE